MSKDRRVELINKMLDNAKDDDKLTDFILYMALNSDVKSIENVSRWLEPFE